jgi:aminoglycoside N3'-acetyltransferase
MFKTTVENLAEHLQQDMLIAENSLVWLHSGIVGLGIIQGGVETITEAFSRILPEGALVIPSFTYSWCNAEVYDSSTTECPDMGGYGKVAWKDKRFKRNSNPNFAIAIMDQTPDKRVENALLLDETKWTCFGDGSVFDHMYRLSEEMPGQIVLLGGAHNDVVFRSTFLHFIEERIGVPYRWNKKFHNPNNTTEVVEQYVRYFSTDEYIENIGIKPPGHYDFPVSERYNLLGSDLMIEKLITINKFGYSKTRMVHIYEFCFWLEEKIKKNLEYLLR